jgi:hypothetical protein
MMNDLHDATQRAFEKAEKGPELEQPIWLMEIAYNAARGIRDLINAYDSIGAREERPGLLALGPFANGIQKSLFRLRPHHRDGG